MKIGILTSTQNGSHLNGLLVYNEMKHQGIDVTLLSFERPYEQIIQIVKREKFDCVLVFGISRYPRFVYERLGRFTKLVVWYADGRLPGKDKGYWETYKDLFDLFIVSVKGMIPVAEKYVKRAIFIPQFYDRVFYTPTSERLDPDYKIHDVCFVGNSNRSKDELRHAWLHKLAERFRLKVLGWVPGLSSHVAFGSEMANVYSQSKVAIDVEWLYALKYFGERPEFKTSDRLFKALGCGCCYITYPIIGIEEFFKPGEHLVMYNGTYEDLCEKIEYYLEHEDEREKIAVAGQEEVLRKHTLTVRVKQYIEAMEEIL